MTSGVWSLNECKIFFSLCNPPPASFQYIHTCIFNGNGLIFLKSFLLIPAWIIYISHVSSLRKIQYDPKFKGYVVHNIPFLLHLLLHWNYMNCVPQDLFSLSSWSFAVTHTKGMLYCITIGNGLIHPNTSYILTRYVWQAK